MNYTDEQVDAVYEERNRLVSALTKFLPSYFTVDNEADDGWRHVIVIEGPTGQMAWHVPDSFIQKEDHPLVHLDYGDNEWDGHTTEEKYRRLASLPDRQVRTQGGF